MRVLAILLLSTAGSAMAAEPAERLWGFADLHAHPAAHLGFGSDARGEHGIIWGKPGLALEEARAALATDLPACYPGSHASFDFDFIRQGTRAQILRSLDSSTGWRHSAGGAPDFRSWPNAQSLDHEQMHVLALRRAYEGGLRLMVATAVDNQLLSVLWTKIGFNLFGNRMPPPSRTFDYDSARRQIDFIRRLASLNRSWMQIVTTAAEAREAIRGNRLALILGLEMDTLSADQILDLVKNHQVRHVIPIHLVDNSFGGMALAENLFNTSNQYLTGHFYQVTCDPSIQFRLGRPSILKPSGSLLLPGAMLVTPLPDDAYHKLGYANCTGGHKNAKGLVGSVYNSLFRELMRAGVLVDVAHMSELSTEGAIRLAEIFHYPLMNSHTGLRHPCGETAGMECGSTERDLKRSHARRLAALGGVLGFGTSAPPANVIRAALKANQAELDPVAKWLTSYQDALSVMGGRGVALGTDMNGFSPQIPFAAVASRYPVTVASRYGPKPMAFPPPPLPRFQLGSRTYDFQKDGLAHYGMLPDFLEAVSERRELRPDQALEALYHTAEDVVEMWEKAEASGRSLF